ncbi:MAG: YfiR/HmsC family protein [Myxococcota bacterium]
MTKVLKYDRSLERGEASEVRLLASEGPSGDALASALARLPSQSINGRPLIVVKSRFDSPAAIASALKGNGVSYIILTDSMPELSVRQALRACESERVPCIALGEERVRAGAAFGVDYKNSKARIFVNYRASQNQGANLAADVLRLAVRVD